MHVQLFTLPQQPQVPLLEVTDFLQDFDTVTSTLPHGCVQCVHVVGMQQAGCLHLLHVQGALWYLHLTGFQFQAHTYIICCHLGLLIQAICFHSERLTLGYQPANHQGDLLH
jgi:hypothetical protein